MIAKYLPENLKTIFKQRKKSVKQELKLTEEDRTFLWNFYKNDIHQLEKITGKNLSNWYQKQVKNV